VAQVERLFRRTVAGVKESVKVEEAKEEKAAKMMKTLGKGQDFLGHFFYSSTLKKSCFP